LLAPEAGAPQDLAPRSPQVCNCFDVSQDAIVKQLKTCSGAAGQRLQTLQAALRCGTQCGSCLPALRRMVADTPETEALEVLP
jgi:assimilatory nitrate reductase catalytic subunit